jgi:hypothetical protein
MSPLRVSSVGPLRELRVNSVGLPLRELQVSSVGLLLRELQVSSVGLLPLRLRQLQDWPTAV